MSNYAKLVEKLERHTDTSQLPRFIHRRIVEPSREGARAVKLKGWECRLSSGRLVRAKPDEMLHDFRRRLVRLAPNDRCYRIVERGVTRGFRFFG